ncbi:MAG: Gfo/Idh/MocA family oxidoreductase [Anaerolineae bacterium]|nr:Gfo/Idh/MocA family oxidoreductase [Anaerolineae bacterium]
MGDKVRIGFIGSGGIAIGHAMRLHDSGLAEVVALSDPSEASLARMKEARPELADVPTFSDYREMLDKVAMDGVEIHSPHCFHARQILDALDAGLHVLCEKPMTSTVADARAVIARRDETGKILTISYQRHYEPTYQFIREMAQGGDLGRLQMVSLVLSQDWLRGTRGTWRQSLEISCGGQLNDSGSHLVDMMLWTTGLEADRVYAEINRYDCEVDIDSAIVARFVGGTLGNVTIMGASPTPFWEFFGVWGSEGAVVYDRLNGVQVLRVGQEPLTPELPPADNNPDLNFVRAILGLEEPGVPAECGLRVSEFTEAAWRSAGLGRPVLVREM